MKFKTYVMAEKQTAEFEVMSKVRTDVRGHFTYVLKGVTEMGHNASALVNRSQWDRFDVPVEERVIDRKVDRRKKRNKSMQPVVGRKKPVPKDRRKAYNEEIEKWLAEHYDIDLESLDGFENGIGGSVQ